MNTTGKQLSRIERTLVLALTMSTIRRTGELARDLGYPEPKQELCRAMSEKIDRVLTETVIGLRGEPGPAVLAEEIDVVVDEVAAASIASVLGAPPVRSSELPN